VHQGIRTGSLKYMLANWKKRGYIEIYGEVMDNENLFRQQYAKTAAYLKKHPSRG
jgi:predicted adenine nucleotide alpha hydrolase (AANH) superfamily ATPase